MKRKKITRPATRADRKQEIIEAVAARPMPKPHGNIGKGDPWKRGSIKWKSETKQT